MQEIIRWIKNQSDRSLAIALMLLGLLSIYLGWRGVSNHVLPSEQIAYLASGAVFGLFALGLAATFWLSADMRDEWQKLDALADQVRRAIDLAEDAATRHAGPDDHL
jgi:hypothetical protein